MTETMTLHAKAPEPANLANSSRRTNRAERVVPWSEFDPLLSQLRQALGNNVSEIMRVMGYAGGTHVAEWRRSGTVPILAMNAAKWLLHELKLPMPAPERKPIRQFDHAELKTLFALVIGLPVPAELTKSLSAKIAAELSR